MTHTYRILSFNIRYSLAPDGPQRWEKRRRLVVERLQAHQPDLVGLQECRLDGQAQYLQRRLPGYAWVGQARGSTHESALEMAPILYRRARFTLLDSGTFWLSASPQVPGSRSWGSALARTASWARLREREGGSELFCFNTHFDHESALARQRSAALLLAQIEQLAGGLPVIVTGDFNAEKDSPPYHQLVAAGRLVDASRARHAPGEAEATFHNYGRGPGQAIDWILASPHFEVLQAGVDRSVQAGLYPSDHYPLFVVLSY
ncbi:MAG: endonuclease/exonuclease/phosphatase family protein [Anaerolineales bacterium]|nr:endonuclease/exonuclease/phosphatase family protein [Anaerolineales bacterium]